MRKNFTTVANRWWPKIMLTRKRSAWWMSLPSPRAATNRWASCEVRNLVTYSPVFRELSWQRYRIKDTDKGPEVWEVKWAVFWRKGENGLPGRRHCLLCPALA